MHWRAIAQPNGRRRNGAQTETPRRAHSPGSRRRRSANRQEHLDLGRKFNVEMPITTEVYRVLYEGKSPKQAVGDLMARALKPEF